MLAACEFSLVKFRYTVIDEKEFERVRAKKRVARLIDSAQATAQSIRFCLTLGTMGMGFVLYAWVQEFFEKAPQSLLETKEGLTIAVAFIATAGIYYITADLLPRSLAFAFPERTLRLTSWFALAVTAIVSPALKVLTFFTKKLSDTKGDEDLNLLDLEVQIRALGEDRPALSKFTQKILQNTLRLRELEASDVLLPRNKIHYINYQEAIADNLSAIKDSGHTRFPLCDGDLDRCVGLVHIKDVFHYQGDALDLIKFKRKILRFPLDAPLEVVLQRMLRLKAHMALVVDEFDGTAGILTLEDLLEELVGEIQDEFDEEEVAIQKIGDDCYLISGLAPIHDLEETLNIVVDDEMVSTFGGWITAQLGHIPQKGETFSFGEVSGTIEKVTETQVLSVEVTVNRRENSEEGED